MNVIMKIAVVTAALAILSGCASQMKVEKRADTDPPANARMAVLPFENLSGAERASEKITEYFQLAMSGETLYETLEYGTLYDGLRRYRIRSSSLLTGEQIDSLAVRFDIDYIVTGSVLEYEEHDNTYLGRVPQVSFNCRMIDCSTGKSIWAATSNGRGDKGEIIFGIGAETSADNLARQMVSKAVDDLSDFFEKR